MKLQVGWYMHICFNVLGVWSLEKWCLLKHELLSYSSLNMTVSRFLGDGQDWELRKKNKTTDAKICTANRDTSGADLDFISTCPERDKSVVTFVIRRELKLCTICIKRIETKVVFAGYITYKWKKGADKGLTPEVPCKTKIQEDLQSPQATLKGPSLWYEYSQSSITVPYAK